MLLSYFSLLFTCGIASALYEREHTPAERMKILGPLANISRRIDFPCKALEPSPTIPTSVHALRPADIQHVAAMGDSLTAANGANALTIIGLLIEYRGFSWSIGGNGDLRSIITLPNIMREFNSDLYGFSTGTGNQNSTGANFNVAKPGAVSADMPGQANLLVQRMYDTLGETSFKQDWKLITFFIGGNDLCDYCKDDDYYSATAFANNVEEALDILHAKMPRTLVNFVTVLNVAELETLNDGFVCQSMQGFLCDCAVDPNTIEQVRYANIEYQKATNALIDSGKYDTRDDFTVVRQPFMEHMKVPATSEGDADFSYFSHDCFHFSKKGHEAAAIELWNNMMEKVGEKTTTWNMDDILYCPDNENGYIYTSKNSFR